MANTLSFIIQKGGCGKTTTTANTAGYLSREGFRILCVDMDPQGNLTQHFGYDSETLPLTLLHLFLKERLFEEVVLKKNDNLHILPNNLESARQEAVLQKSYSPQYLLRDLLTPVHLNYDYILIDCPPTLGLFSVNSLAASNEFIIVVSPEFLPMKAIKPLYETFRQVKYQLNHSLQFNGIVLTMCDFRTRHSQEILQILRRNFPNKLYQSYIRNNVSLKEASAYGQTIFEYKPESPGAFDYQNFSEELIRDHHRTMAKRQHYQRLFEKMHRDDREQILIVARENLSGYVKSRLDDLDESAVLEKALIIERNKIIEKLYPYRQNAEIGNR
jgi:chromosome partitioning protein